MVRVISVHNFLKQDITSVDEMIDFATVPPDILLLVQSDHSIFVKNLSDINDSGYLIPTVDQVFKIIYSIKGNYIGTLERKLTRNGLDVCHIRIYLNWENLRRYKEFPAMRARIAGRVTPLSQNHEGLEMIEIPAQNMPDNIACCPISGNLLLSSKNTLTLYKLCVQVHDISKMYFIDFKQMPFECLLSFIPVRLQLAENVVAAQNDEFLHVFRIIYNALPSFVGDKEFNNECFENSTLRFPMQHKTISYERLVEECMHEVGRRKLSGIHRKHTATIRASVYEEPHNERGKISNLSFPLRHDFPTISIHKTLESRCNDVQKQNPFLAGQDLKVNVIPISSHQNRKLEYETESLLQYQVLPLMLGSATNRDMYEKFTCLILKPFYSCDADLNVKCDSIESEHFGRLKTVACFFGTQQEGYLHSFRYDTVGREVYLENYTLYPFTAPVIDVQLEDSFLHALTDAGLETYTMRASQHIPKKDILACPSGDDPVCLIGLHPFVNIFRLGMTNKQLLLFANSEETSSGSVWTLYKLHLPGPTSLWFDFLTVAEENKWEAPATYCHLVGEGHLVLKTYLNCTKWISQIEGSESRVHSPTRWINKKEMNLTDKLFRESCALLGDYHIINEDADKASDYYSMSGYKACDIARRTEVLMNGIPCDLRANYNEKAIRSGLICHLKRVLASYDEKYFSFPGNREEFYNPEIGSITSILLDCMENENIESISDLVLNSVVLREFATDRILKIMKHILTKSSPPHERDALTLALMCIQKDQVEQAKTVLLTITPDQLQKLLQNNFHLLFEEHNCLRLECFAELSMVLIETYPVVMGRILSDHINEKRDLNLAAVLKIFLDILPSGNVQSKNSSIVLKIILESYFERSLKTKGFDFKSSEALKILLRIYLTFLRQKIGLECNTTEENEVFSKYRRAYLNEVPPFGPEINQHSCANQCNDSSVNLLEKELKCTLLKLQGLLSIDNLPVECAVEVRNFVSNQADVYGSLSLQSLSAANVQEAVELLLTFAPQAVPQYVKDCVRDSQDWKFLLKRTTNKMNLTKDDLPLKCLYERILKDLLLLCAKSLEIEDLLEVLPRDLEDGELYLTIAQNNAQAKHIKTLIATTGKQLQATLYDTIPNKSGNPLF